MQTYKPIGRVCFCRNKNKRHNNTRTGVHTPVAEVLPRARTHPAFQLLHDVPVRDSFLLAFHALHIHGGIQALPLAGGLLHHEQVCGGGGR